MNLLIVYLMLFFLFLFSFFAGTSDRTHESPVPEGLLYSSEISSHTAITDHVTETTLYRDNSIEDLPVYLIASDIALPPKFVGRRTPQESADYRLVSANGPVPARGPAPKPRPVPQRRTPGTDDAPEPRKENPLAVVKEDTEIVINENALNNIIVKSDRTYFFAVAEQTIGDVTVRVHTVTPWQNKDILKFRITNRQGQYFFIANASIYTGTALIMSENYFDPLVSPGKTLDAIAVIPRSKDKSFVLKLTESGGRNRVFNVPFTTPQ